MRAGVVGSGPVGRFLAARLDLRRGVDWAGRHQALSPGSDLIFLAVPDAAIAVVATNLRSRTDAALVHCSGATSLAALGPGRSAVWHPMRAFPKQGLVADLDGAVVGLRGDEDVCNWLAQQTSNWGGEAQRIDEEDALLAHAGCCFAAGFCAVMVLEAMALLEQAGLSADAAKRAAAGLSATAVRAALDGHGLTGPALRGDVDTMRAHLSILGPRVALYRSLTDAVGRHGEIADPCLELLRK
jgi:predicted short-subunit dehydrogenase-like oxidoreductase (DUF2520 family)